MSTEIATIQTPPQVLATLCEDLTPKQKLFIYYYLEHRNGTRAARLAGYNGNDATLSAISGENLRKPLIREAIEQYYKSRLISPDCVLAELSDIAHAKLTKSGIVKPDHKIRSLELMGKHHKLFTEKVETEASLSDGDVTRLSESIASAILEAAAQRRAALVQADTTIVKVTPQE